jgi:hypothetical protein
MSWSTRTAALLVLTVAAPAAAGQAAMRVPSGLAVPPLLTAAAANDTQAVDLLLARGANPNEQSGPGAGPFITGQTQVRTALMHAAMHGNEAMVRRLLAAGARALARSEEGFTASEYAFHWGHARTRAILREAEEAEYSPVARHLLAEEVALRTIEHLAVDAPPQVVTTFSPGLLAQIQDDAAAMMSDWGAPVAARDDELAWSLTRLATAFEWALHTVDVELARGVAEDLAAKRKDCDARPERRFGTVKISVRTLDGGSERMGVQVRYVEGFYFALLPRRPDLASLWREFPRVSAILDEPLPAGDYVMVAWAGGRAISEPKPISVGRNRSTRFDLVLR